MDNRKFRHGNSIAWQVEQTYGYVYVFDVKSNMFYIFEDSGKDIWLSLCEGATVSEVISQIETDYQISHLDAVHDTIEFVNRLLDMRLLQHA